MSYKRILNSDEKKKQKRTNEEKIHVKYQDYKDLWLEKGPIWFAENVLTSPPDIPIHPDFVSNNNPPLYCEGCRAKHTKFRTNGVPYHIILSEDQKNYLNDIWSGKALLTLLAAGRGGGKTFIFAVRYTWLLATQSIGITYMGGSMKQSKLCQDYIDNWRYDNDILYQIIDKSNHGVERYMTTIWRGHLDFSACSPTSARGPHVNEVGLDEVCVAEDKSEEGGKAVSAAMWQVTGKRVGRLDMASTAHFIHGTFYEYMMNPEKYGFKVYKWAIAKHVSGKKPLECYTDKNPSNWISNVWWMSNADIQKMRKAKSNEEWLCESLGEASMASGAVFKKDDLDIVICSLCEECEPYNWDKCKLCKLANTGTQDDPTKYILDRRIGFDYGISESPTAVTIVGRKSDIVFVLFNDEQIGLREEDKVEWVHTNCQQWKTWDFIPDPAVGGKALNEKFEDLGYAVFVIPEQDKAERVYNLINFVEKRKIIVPNIFWHLTQSLRKCAWDSDGKIRKVDDHSFDSLCYSLVDWTVETESDIMSEFLNGNAKPKTKDLLK